MQIINDLTANQSNLFSKKTFLFKNPETKDFGDN